MRGVPRADGVLDVGGVSMSMVEMVIAGVAVVLFAAAIFEALTMAAEEGKRK